MQAKQKIAKILVVALIVSLVLGACGGGNTGSTWFNLPSIYVRLQDNGTAKVFGFNVGAVVQPALIQQLQTANIQKVEVRVGYNGIHVYTNGSRLPYIEWDQDSVAVLQGVIRQLPTLIPNADLVANVLPWLRTFGLGVALDVPVAQGASALDMPRWSGETTYQPESPEATTIGPITVASLVFDDQGEATIEGIPVSALEEALGVALPVRLDATTLGILSAIGAETFRIETHPNGIRFYLNEELLPSVAYDTQKLGNVVAVAGAFVSDPALVETLNQVVPLLPGADVEVVVSFTGEPVAETSLAPITVAIQPDGSVQMFGFPVVADPVVPLETIENLQSANVQQLQVAMQPDELVVAANGQVLPTVQFTDESLNTIAQLAGPMLGMTPEAVTSLLNVVRDVGLDIRVTVPLAEGAEPVEIPDELDTTMTPPDLGNMTPPTLRLNLDYDDGELVSVGGLTAEQLSRLSIELPGLPPDVVTLLDELDVQDVAIVTDPAALNLLLDGETALTVAYDANSLNAALDVATPFLGDSPITQPALSKLLREAILPLVPAADIEVNINVN